jgi:hypothetical protein
MAYVSFGLNIGVYETEPNQITIGTDDGGAGNNVTVSVNKAAAGLTHKAVIIALEAIIRRLEDGRFDDLGSV